MIHANTHEHLVVTGATGLIGHHLLARLLRGGVRCAVILRSPNVDVMRLRSLLAPLGVDLSAMIADERVVPVRGDLLGSIEQVSTLRLGALVHLAGCTRFHADSNGDPARTNIGGTTNLLDWATAHHIRTVHFISTAYAGGRCVQPVPESPLCEPPSFNNDYERSKWTCERLCRDWASCGTGRAATIIRPSIVVGDFTTGRSTSLTGFYLAVRAVESAVALGRRRSGQSARISLTLPGHARGVQNILPVDYVAHMVASIMSSESHRGGVFNVVNPNPPANDMLRRAVEAAIPGAQLSFASEPGQPPRTRLERAFDRVVEPIFPYLSWSPLFEHSNASRIAHTHGIECPVYDASALARLCEFAVGHAPLCSGSKDTPSEIDARAAEYFERFLPTHIARSSVARLIGLTADVRFVLTGIAQGAWLCRFDDGRLQSVVRTCNGVREHFGYRVDATTFLRIVAAELDPQQAFLGGHIELQGDVERALKMAMVMHQFNTEFPFRPAAGIGQKGTLHHA